MTVEVVTTTPVMYREAATYPAYRSIIVLCGQCVIATVRDVQDQQERWEEVCNVSEMAAVNVKAPCASQRRVVSAVAVPFAWRCDGPIALLLPWSVADWWNHDCRRAGPVPYRATSTCFIFTSRKYLTDEGSLSHRVATRIVNKRGRSDAYGGCYAPSLPQPVKLGPPPTRAVWREHLWQGGLGQR